MAKQSSQQAADARDLLGAFQEVVRQTEAIEELLSEAYYQRSVQSAKSLSKELHAARKQFEPLAERLFATLLPAVESGEIVLVCEASGEDLARAERTHAAFVQAFRALALPPLDSIAGRLALTAAAQRVARARRVKFDDAALDRAMDLSDRFGEPGVHPGGAVDLLRSAASVEAEVSPARRAPSTRTIAAAEVTRAFSMRTGYPRELIDPEVRLDADAVLSRLRSRVEGQDAAILLLSNLVVTLKTGLADPQRPLGSFLFVGPTGVGKTESALALTDYLFGDDRRLVRFDMSEYAEPGSAVRLVNEGSGRDGALARRVREQPFGVVLLDELKKQMGAFMTSCFKCWEKGGSPTPPAAPFAFETPSSFSPRTWAQNPPGDRSASETRPATWKRTIWARHARSFGRS